MILPMHHIIDLWFWRVTDPVSGRRYTTRHRMVEADALDLDPGAARVTGSQELRQVPDDPLALSTNGWQRSST
jgi:hypothetical protein